MPQQAVLIEPQNVTRSLQTKALRSIPPLDILGSESEPGSAGLQ